VEELIPKIQNN